MHPIQLLHFVFEKLSCHSDFEFSAISIGQFTPNITSIVCKYSESGFVDSKRTMEHRGRSIEIISEESEFWRRHLGRSISSGQRGQKRPIEEDWMLQSDSSKREGAEVAKFRSGSDCCWGITLERGADNRWRLFCARNQHSHELPSAMEDALGG